MDPRRVNHADVIGKTFGRLTAVSYDPESQKVHRYICQCICGKTKSVARSNLLSGHSLSCSCLRVELHPGRTHGLSSKPIYRVWRAMINRCYLSSVRAFKRYGARGITVCARWRESAANYASDVGPRPDGMEVDRIDNNGGYWCGKPECTECGPLGREPNWRWATHTQNARNRASNRILTVDGVSKTVAEWAEGLGIHPDVIHSRLGNGWSEHDAVTRPVRAR